MKIKSSYLKLAVSLVLIMLAGVPLSAMNKDGQMRKILCISSFSPDNHDVQEEVLSFVHDAGRDDTSFMPVLELMDCRSLNSVSKWQQTMSDILKRNPNPDVIVLLGNEAAITFFSMPEEKYREIPLYVLHCNSMLAGLPKSCGITSVQTDGDVEVFRMDDVMHGYNVRYAELLEYDVATNIELVQRLYGHTNNIAVLTDNSYTGLCMQYAVRDVENRFPKFNIHYLDGRKLDMGQALERMKSLPNRMVLLLGGWTTDKNEATYLSNAVYAFKNVRSYALLPVFSFSGAGMGHWAIGGYIPWQSDGQQHLDEFFSRDLATEMKQEPQIRTFPLKYVFDDAMLKSMEISREEVPGSAVFLNRELTSMDMLMNYKWYILLVLCIVVILIVAVLVTVAYSIRISRLRNTLQASERQLIKEKENLQKSEHRLRVAKERAEEAGMAKSMFISNMSHEIRTPLNSIVGFSQIMTEMVKDQPEVNEFAKIIQHDSEKLVKLIDGLLEISDIQSGKVSVVKERVDAVSFLSSMVDNMKQDMKEGVTLVFKSSCNKLEIETDVNRLIQVMMNLIQNSVKHTSAGSITVGVEKDVAGTMALFSVTDTGCGISDKLGKVIFDRFEKREEFIQGAGMGLTVCQTVVEFLGGRIWLDESYHEGARFMFTHPL